MPYFEGLSFLNDIFRNIKFQPFNLLNGPQQTLLKCLPDISQDLCWGQLLLLKYFFDVILTTTVTPCAFQKASISCGFKGKIWRYKLRWQIGPNKIPSVLIGKSDPVTVFAVFFSSSAIEYRLANQHGQVTRNGQFWRPLVTVTVPLTQNS